MARESREYPAPRPTAQGAFPPAPRADLFTSRMWALRAEWTRPVRDSPGFRTAWPGRRCPLVALVCNYSLRAHSGIRLRQPLRTRKVFWGVDLRPEFPEPRRLTVHP